jgi:DNA-binding transcriptional ArsR family regulator
MSLTEDSDLQSAAEIFKALSNPVRIALLRLLSTQSTVTTLVDATGLSQPLVSQHLRVLRGAGLVRVTRSGREAIYRVADDHITHVIEDAISHASEPRPAVIDTGEPAGQP